uniref:VWFD domain-containing protein n=1 Tax=Eptatretus burgeri TaxID=7764 RepID=A0A8C4WWZ6_EPTBU
MCLTNSVRVKIGTGPHKNVAETTEVALRLKSIDVQLLRNWVVMVDGKAVSLPYVHKSISVEQQMGVILLNTQLGIKMQWNSRGRLELSLPNLYWGQLCGLCGNFNGKPHDDQTLRTLEPAHSDAQFGTSWQVSLELPSHSTLHSQDPHSRH